LCRALSDDQNLSMTGWVASPDEAWLLAVALAVGLIAALIPAIRAYRTDIAATLAH